MPKVKNIKSARKPLKGKRRLKDQGTSGIKNGFIPRLSSTPEKEEKLCSDVESGNIDKISPIKWKIYNQLIDNKLIDNKLIDNKLIDSKLIDSKLIDTFDSKKNDTFDTAQINQSLQLNLNDKICSQKSETLVQSA